MPDSIPEKFKDCRGFKVEYKDLFGGGRTVELSANNMAAQGYIAVECKDVKQTDDTEVMIIPLDDAALRLALFIIGEMQLKKKKEGGYAKA